MSGIQKTLPRPFSEASVGMPTSEEAGSTGGSAASGKITDGAFADAGTATNGMPAEDGLVAGYFFSSSFLRRHHLSKLELFIRKQLGHRRDKRLNQQMLGCGCHISTPPARIVVIRPISRMCSQQGDGGTQKMNALGHFYNCLDRERAGARVLKTDRNQFLTAAVYHISDEFDFNGTSPTRRCPSLDLLVQIRGRDALVVYLPQGRSRTVKSEYSNQWFHVEMFKE